MKHIIALLAFLMLSQAYAQGVQTNPQGQLPQAQAKRTMIYDERTNELVEVAPEVQAQPEVQTVQANPNNQNPIYILNNQNQKYQGYQGQVQEQPVTVVEDSPLRASPAENMRRKRQETEAATEDGIVQALERARMEDEMRRRDRFNSAIGTGVQDTTTQMVPVQQTAPQVLQPVVPAPAPVTQVVTPAPVVVAPELEKDETDKVDIRAEVREALKDYNAKPEEPKPEYYISAQVGLGKYPDVVNVRGDVASGFSIGMVTPQRVVAEGSFIYSGYEMEDVRTSNPYYPYYPRIVDLKQYNFGAALKYQILPGRFRPNVGAMASYVRRTFADSAGTQFRTSDAFDVGLVAGVDVLLTDSFALGFDFRYMTNIAYRDNTDSRQSFVYPRQGDKPVEKLDYYTGALTGKFTF